MRTLLNKIRKLLKDRRTRRFWSRTISVVAALVVFVTTYALVLPAITMERQAYCGLEAHQHTDDCFERQLICTIPESPGHHHGDSCYTMRQEYSCTLEEHTHAEGCYDEEGNLICEIPEHTHEEGTCWQEVPELTCTLEESDGHLHDDSCYENVLVCGKEVHTHSEACYGNPDELLETAAVATTQEGAYGISTDEGFDGSGTYNNGDSDGTGDDIGWTDSDEYGNAARSDAALSDDPSTGLTDSDNAANGITAVSADVAGSDALSEEAQQDLTSGGISEEENRYVPQLDPLFFNAVLNKHTGIYYYHVPEGETVEDSSLITDWKKVDKNTELGPNDLLRVYLSYTIPAGSLNETNPTASYRLPANLHLTDDQVNGINAIENGIAAAYIDYNTLTVTDPDNYHRYLGAEAVEGTRTPDQTLGDYLAQTGGGAGTSNSGGTGDGNAAGQEFISATVRVQNVYDTEGLYGEKGAYLGQDLIFTFSPYTIEKNQHTYDASGQPTRAGQKVRGWFALDFNLTQVDLDEPYIEEVENLDNIENIEVDSNRENENTGENTDDENAAVSDDDSDTTVLISREFRTANIVFVEKNDSLNLDEISASIKVVTAENYERIEANTDDAENTENIEENGEEQLEENAESIEEDLTSQEAEAAEDVEGTDNEDKSDADDEDKKKEDLTAEDEKDKDKTVSQDDESEKTIMPAMSFEDSIRVRTGKPAGVEEGSAGSAAASAAEALPKKAKVIVRVEADEGTFPAGTTMVLSAVEDLDAVAETLRETVENGGDGANARDKLAENNGFSDATGSRAGSESNEYSSDAGSSAAETNNKNIKTYGFQAVDISFLDSEGNEIEPEKPVRVALTSETVEQVRKDAESSAVTDPVIVHMDNDGNAEQMKLVGLDEVEPAQGRTEEELLEESQNAADQSEDESLKIPKEEVDEKTSEDESEEVSKEETVNQESREEPADKPSEADRADDVALPATAVDNETRSNSDQAEKDAVNQNPDVGTSEDAGTASTLEFRTDAFSVYAIVYTVELYTNIITDSGETYRISVTYDESSGIPLDAELRVREITREDETYDYYYTESLKGAAGYPGAGDEFAPTEADKKPEAEAAAKESALNNENAYARFFDIEIWADGRKLEPESDVSVSIRLSDVPEPDDKRMIRIFHFDGNQPVVIPYISDRDETQIEAGGQQTANKKGADIDKNTEDAVDEFNKETEFHFTASSFSVYSVVSYTVDFHWNVNGKMYEISIPGGGFASFSKLMEVIGIAHNGMPDEDKELSEKEEAQDSDEREPESLLTFDDIQVSEDTRKFVADVVNVEFSSPDLVWVGKNDNETTVGRLKEDKGLEVQYSADLTEEQILQINEQTVEAGDWALISLKAFVTTETLTVTMNTGEIFTIRVTDATPSRVYGLNTSGLNGLFTVNMFNYGPPGTLDKEANHVNNNTAWNNDDSNVQDGINGYTALDFMAYGTTGSGANHFTGGTSIRQGIVMPTLNTSGYPTLTANSGGGNLDSLFNTTANGTTKQVYQNVQGLFYKSNVDGSSNTNGSYYSYDSDRYYAYKNTSNQIEFYQQYKFGNNDKDVNDNGMNNKPVGFFPFTYPDNSQLCPHPSDVTWSRIHPGGGTHGTGYYDHQFGLTLAGDFQIPEGKKVDNQNMIFKFSGDDDMWVFIDDVLVLDIGGIHHPSSGMIDFTTGKVTVDNSVVGVKDNSTNTINMKNGNKVTADIATIFSNAGRVWDGSQYSGHTIKVFYMERGGIYSNCKITFNIPLTLGKGSAAIVKKDADPANTVNGGKLEGAIFGLWTNPECSGDPVMTKRSGSDGSVVFDNLTVGADANNLQVYYMKEIRPPFGYLKDDSIYTLRPGAKQNGVYPYTITDKDGSPLEAMDQAPYYPIINNTAAKPIGLAVLKKWQTASDTAGYMDPSSLPAGVSAKFRVKRYRSFDIVEMDSEGLYKVLYSERKLDAAFNSSSNAAYTVTLPVTGTQDPWKHVFSNLPLTEQGSQTYGGTQHTVLYYYEYFIEETDTPDHFETIYIDDDGEVVFADSIGDLATDKPDSNQTIVNRELIDVPAQKHWDDFAGSNYDWTATLQLDYRDIPVPSDGVDVNAIPWAEYHPREPEYCKQISKSSPTTEFPDLPMYITKSDGKEYRREYSIVEIAYKVTRLSDNTVVFEYDKDRGYVYPQGDTYTPWFDHDAGEDDDYDDDIYPGTDEYNVEVHNLRENRNIQKKIDLTVKKEWSDQQYYADSNAKAKFQLKRYILTEYRNYEGTDFANRPKVEIHLNDGTKDIEILTVPQGVRMSIHGFLKPESSGTIVFDQGISGTVENVTTSPTPFDIEFIADASKTITLISGEECVVGGKSGLRFKELEGTTQPEELDNAFCIEFELDKDNNWTRTFPESNPDSQHHGSNDILPAVEVSVLDADGNTANTYVYRYFIEEVECTPDSFHATFTDEAGTELLGDEGNQVYFDTTIKATNRPTGLNVLKVDLEHHNRTLPDAEFQLRKLNGDPPVPATIGGTYTGTVIPPVSTATGSDGIQTFKPPAGLEPGYYELTEMKAPDGYVLTADPTVYIKVEELGVIKLLKRDDSGAVLWDEAAEEGESVGYASVSTSTTAEDGKTITFKILNEPGAELPSTGGNGTHLIYILGGVLTGFGLLISGKKRVRE